MKLLATLWLRSKTRGRNFVGWSPGAAQHPHCREPLLDKSVEVHCITVSVVSSPPGLIHLDTTKNAARKICLSKIPQASSSRKINGQVCDA
ncbi:hypothetical protein TNCV_2127621 [Trichonephila clavipes]|nr:hypothetical protein TNCV_2127621 [Trichonephila clavipes]